MDAANIREILKDPLVLNFVSMMFALERTYDLFIEKIPAWGHGLVAIFFLAGVLAALPLWRSENGRWINYASYGCFVFGSLLLAIFVAIDVCLIENLMNCCGVPGACVKPT